MGDPEALNCCEFCQKLAQQKCSRCHIVFYCSRECQKSHFPVHKMSCSLPYEVREIHGKGKGVVAKEKLISQGQLIISEHPLFMITNITDVRNIASHVTELQRLVSQLDGRKRKQFFSLFNARPDLQILGLFGSNSITIPPPSMNKFGSTTDDQKPRAAVFATLSRINHSCVPNVVWSWNASKNSEELRAIVDILPGSELLGSGQMLHNTYQKS